MTSQGDAVGIRIAVVDMEPYYPINLRDYAALHTGVEQCDVYRTGGELLTALRAGIAYDAVVAEAFLPDITPTAFLQKLDGLNLVNRPVVLMMADAENPRSTAALLQVGADQVIRKPDSVQELLDYVLAMAATSEQYLETRVKERIWWSLHELHLISTESSYQYLADAVFLQTMADYNYSVKELYPMVAKRCGGCEKDRGETRVESAIRRLLEANLNQNCATYRRLLRKANLPEDTVHIGNLKFISGLAQLIREEIGPRVWLNRQQNGGQE